MENKEIFIQDISVDTQTVFHKDGHINIYPCDYVEDLYLVSGAAEVRQRGVMITDDEGTCRFKPYAKNGRKQYHVLFQSKFTQIKETQEDLIFAFRFRKKFGNRELLSLLRKEFSGVSQWIKTWKPSKN